MSIRYTQSCPTCGRRIEIDAALMGRLVACQHCQAEFVSDGAPSSASGGASGENPADEVPVDDPLLARVERALKRAEGAASLAR